MTPLAIHHDSADVASLNVAWIATGVLFIVAAILAVALFRAYCDSDNLHEQLADSTGDLAQARDRIAQLELGLAGAEAEVTKWKDLCWDKETAIQAALTKCDNLARRIAEDEAIHLANGRPSRGTPPRAERTKLRPDELAALRDLEAHWGETADGAA